jgi:hypothetical protein
MPFDPIGGGFEWFYRQTTMVDSALFLSREQTCIFQNTKVFRDSGQRNVKRLGQFGNARFSPCQPLKDGTTGWICQSRKNRR